LLPISAGPLTIEPSSAPDIAVAAELGGRIELNVRAPRRAGFDAGSLASAKATLTDRAERATELELQYDWFNPEETVGSSTLERYVADSPLLAPGLYRLYLECPGFECIDAPVTLVGGETNFSEFELIAKPSK
jgi:hypothetical protein